MPMHRLEAKSNHEEADSGSNKAGVEDAPTLPEEDLEIGEKIHLRTRVTPSGLRQLFLT